MADAPPLRTSIRWPLTGSISITTPSRASARRRVFASLIGRTDLVPTDRPIDGIDTSKFLLGDDDGTGRTTVLFYGPTVNSRQPSGATSRLSFATPSVLTNQSSPRNYRWCTT